MHTKVLKYNHSYNRSQLQYSIKTLAIKILHKKVDNCGTKKIVKCSNANKSYQLQYCKQKLSLATCAHKSYRSFDAILRFFAATSSSRCYYVTVFVRPFFCSQAVILLHKVHINYSKFIKIISLMFGR